MRDQREQVCCRAGRGVAFAFAPFPSYEDIGSARTPGAVKGGVFCAFIGAKRRPLTARTVRISLYARERGHGEVQEGSPPTKERKKPRLPRGAGATGDRLGCGLQSLGWFLGRLLFPDQLAHSTDANFP